MPLTRALRMKHAVWAAAAAFAALLALHAPLHAAPVNAPAVPDLAAAGDDVVARTNALRRAQGLTPVMSSAELTRAAAAFAAWMAAEDRYGHDADGHGPAQRAQDQGYAWCSVAENIAWEFNSVGFTTPALARGLFQGWVDSPPHRHNLLDPNITETGIGLARSPRSERVYAVQMFGRPQSLQMRFELANRAGAAVAYELDGQDYTLRPNAARSHTLCSGGGLKVQMPGDGTQQLQAADGRRYVFQRQGSGWRIASGE